MFGSLDLFEAALRIATENGHVRFVAQQSASSGSSSNLAPTGAINYMSHTQQHPEHAFDPA